LDIAQQLNFEDITDALKSKSTLESGMSHALPSCCYLIAFDTPILRSDPTVPLFKNWLISLGAGEYSSRFIEAGYDLPFVAKHGLSDKDLDCVGIPNSKMGLSRKISELHQL